MKAPSKPSRIPRYTTLHQPPNRGYSAPIGEDNGGLGQGSRGQGQSLRYASNSAGEPGSSVRNFFRERRQIDNNYPLQDIRHHYNQYKGQPVTRAKPPPSFRKGQQKPPAARKQPLPPQRQQQGWNRNNPLPGLTGRGSDSNSMSSVNNTRENSSCSGMTENDRHEERSLTIEEMQKKEDQDRILALIAEKEAELKNLKNVKLRQASDERRQKERDRIKRAKPRVKQMDWQNGSPEPSQPSRKWSSEEDDQAEYQDPIPRKPAHVRRRTPSRPLPEPEEVPPHPSQRGGYKMEVSMSPPAAHHRPSPPPREPSPPPAKPRRAKPPPKKRAMESPVERKQSPPPRRKQDISYDIPLDATYEPPAKLVPCRVCGRNFAEERIQKHQQACSKADKALAKRKVFDPVKMRTDGTEQAQFVNTKQPEPPKKPKKDWRKAHDELIKTLRYNRKMAEIEKNGGNLADLPPPPPIENPDYVQCPHCNRKFNEGAAERHIPRCKDLNTKARPQQNRGAKRR